MPPAWGGRELRLVQLRMAGRRGGGEHERDQGDRERRTGERRAGGDLREGAQAGVGDGSHRSSALAVSTSSASSTTRAGVGGSSAQATSPARARERGDAVGVEHRGEQLERLAAVGRIGPACGLAQVESAASSGVSRASAPRRRRASTAASSRAEQRERGGGEQDRADRQPAGEQAGGDRVDRRGQDRRVAEVGDRARDVRGLKPRGGDRERPLRGRLQLLRACRRGHRDRREADRVRALQRQAGIVDALQGVAVPDHLVGPGLVAADLGRLRLDVGREARRRELDAVRAHGCPCDVDVDLRREQVAEEDRPRRERGRDGERRRQPAPPPGAPFHQPSAMLATTAITAAPTTAAATSGCGLIGGSSGCAAARPIRGTFGRSPRARSSRAAPGRLRPPAKVASSAARRRSLAVRRARASRPETLASSTWPLTGSLSGRTSPPTSGKLCSQTGSCTTTGTTSQRRAEAVSQVDSSIGGPRKSEITKTKVPDESSARKRPRKSSPRVIPSSGAS